MHIKLDMLWSSHDGSSQRKGVWQQGHHNAKIYGPTCGKQNSRRRDPNHIISHAPRARAGYYASVVERDVADCVSLPRNKFRSRERTKTSSEVIIRRTGIIKISIALY